MATRIKDWFIPYTWWDGIEITNNHVINVLLREANNLIHVNENRELYVDLQLPDWIEPDDDFPVWVTTGRILEEDWWQQSWLILNWKTTSWDYARLIYANDWNLYVDLWDWQWILLWSSSHLSCNTRTFDLDSTDNLTAGQTILDWYLEGNMPLIKYTPASILATDPCLYVFSHETTESVNQLIFRQLPFSVKRWNNGYSTLMDNEITITWDWVDTVTGIDSSTNTTLLKVLEIWKSYSTAFIPTQDWDPTSKKYVDDELAKKQDILTPWTRITITVDPNTWNTIIAADVSWVMTYKWNLSTVSDLSNIQNPSVWDCYYIEGSHTLYAWDWSQWNDIWGTGIDLTNYFNKQTDTTDNIAQWSTNLFVTSQEKTTWNNKQDALTAWNNITIDQNNVISAAWYTEWDWIDINSNNVVSNTKPFDPENAGTMWQVLRKTNTWYKWVDSVSWWVDSVNWRTGDVIVKEFEPDNTGSTWQVLKKTQHWYEWQNESWWGGWGWHTYSAWEWIDITNYVITNTSKTQLFTINSSTNPTPNLSIVQDAIDWYNEWNLPIIKAYKSDRWEAPQSWYRFFLPDVITNHSNPQTWDTWQVLPFYAIYNENDYHIDNVNWYTALEIPMVDVKIVDWDVDTATITAFTSMWSNFLSTSHNYSTAYTPLYNWSPATKKYVDDHDTVISGDNWVTYTIKVSNSDPASWTASNIITFVL